MGVDYFYFSCIFIRSGNTKKQNLMLFWLGTSLTRGQTADFPQPISGNGSLKAESPAKASEDGTSSINLEETKDVSLATASLQWSCGAVMVDAAACLLSRQNLCKCKHKPAAYRGLLRDTQLKRSKAKRGD